MQEFDEKYPLLRYPQFYGILMNMLGANKGIVRHSRGEYQMLEN